VSELFELAILDSCVVHVAVHKVTLLSGLTSEPLNVRMYKT